MNLFSKYIPRLGGIGCVRMRSEYFLNCHWKHLWLMTSRGHAWLNMEKDSEFIFKKSF